MRSVDTNVVIRFLMADDADQFERARQVFAGGDVLILTSVLLETEWVLRSNYQLKRDAIIGALGALATDANVRVEDTAQLAGALALAAQGLDFADALHLAGSRGCTDFVTFDRPLVRRAAALKVMPVVEP